MRGHLASETGCGLNIGVVHKLVSHILTGRRGSIWDCTDELDIGRRAPKFSHHRARFWGSRLAWPDEAGGFSAKQSS